MTGKFVTTEYDTIYQKDRLLLVTESLLEPLKRLNRKLDMEIEDVKIDDDNNLWILGHPGAHGNFYILLRCRFP